MKQAKRSPVLAALGGATKGAAGADLSVFYDTTQPPPASSEIRRAERLLAGQLGAFRRMYDLAKRFHFYDDAQRLLAHLHALETVRVLGDMDTSLDVLGCNERETGRTLDVWERRLGVACG